MRSRHALVKEEIVQPPNRFTAGEESALVNWINSAQSLPVFRPDKGTPLRMEGVLPLCRTPRPWPMSPSSHGMAPDRSRPRVGREPGTCLVTVSGAVAHPGVVEVDLGTSLWGIAQRSQPIGSTQALLVGGYGGAWVGPQHFGTPYASMSLRTIGAVAGVGIIVVLGRRHAASLNPPGSPATWPPRAPVSADRASTGCRRSPTICLADPRPSQRRPHEEAGASPARGERAWGLPPPRRCGQPGPKRADGLCQRRRLPPSGGPLSILATTHFPPLPTLG